ncbi:hypothetical protein [Streptomyces sp. SID3343]|uniref:hypothetical protein n=1 Tax=Streptomyces sp. SID3343 TaxID=2690260 RepID=UPI00136E972C|nr:hypothetical protein [Streptomyces sp. SID3343]MYV97760.1 hypothetical protein [Streptomyces sp. SID3343]
MPETDPQPLSLRTLTLIVEGMPSTTWCLDDEGVLTDLKAKPFVLAEGSHYKLVIGFVVDHENVFGLRYVKHVYRKGVRVAKDDRMLGSFGPTKETHEVTIPQRGWEETPGGTLNRGPYTAKVTLTDDGGVTHGAFEYGFEIRTSRPATEPIS